MEKEIKKTKNEDIEKNKTTAALSCIWILALFIYSSNKKSKFCQFHAKQGIVLFFLSFVTIVPVLGWMFGIVLFFVSVWGFLRAQAGEWYKIPYVYDLSKKIKL